MLSMSITGCKTSQDKQRIAETIAESVQNNIDNNLKQQTIEEPEDEQENPSEGRDTDNEQSQDNNAENEEDSSIPTSFENCNGVIPICVDDNVWGMTKEEFEQYSGVSLGGEGIEIPNDMYAYEPVSVPVYKDIQVSCQFDFYQSKIVGYSFMIQDYLNGSQIVSGISKILYDSYGENDSTYCWEVENTDHYFWLTEKGIIYLTSADRGNSCSIQYWSRAVAYEVWPVSEALCEIISARDSGDVGQADKSTGCFESIAFDTVLENVSDETGKVIAGYLDFLENPLIDGIQGFWSTSHQFGSFDIDSFSIIDMDRDGIPELILQQLDYEMDGILYNYYLAEYYIFTYRDGSLCYAGSVYDNIPRAPGKMFLLNGKIIFGTDHVSDCNLYFYGELNGTNLIVNKGGSQKIDLEGGKQEYIYAWNGKEISLEEAEYYFWYEGIEGEDKYIKEVRSVYIHENTSENRELYRILMGAIDSVY